ncbi:MAG: bifunctional diaminohydroxyphosphoribosylaminopyrimidine deaminase/5-amino-6-(5-phosphoribosylamino)uracil reductase RibD [Deltaproteobacteria bacterium]|nr:MAG: bifunctional diaminohydroxyphosphoribosylaminopyrimidine deaminase/5-amino-6-(5-phosphoribosylamino)uracil reductase RibD [Deltaproteobacteria bacterium]
MSRATRRARDEAMMQRALAEARKATGRTSPNPPVGAVVVRGEEVIATGHTAPAGGPHAEVVALERAGERARGATLYTTLEPCSHAGRTPPCTDAILRAGVARVVVGSTDRNPQVAGIERLREAGVDVECGILEAACDEQNRYFFTWITEGRPYVVLKAAMTLDGRIATATGDSQWISCEASRKRAHRWRDELDAILVGAGTVRHDDPRLTTRRSDRPGRDPVRVILDGRLSTDPQAQIYGLDSEAPTLLVVPVGTPAEAVAPYQRGPTEILEVEGAEGRVEIPALLRALGDRGLMSVLVEGGARVHGAFLASGLADELRLFLAPKLLGAGPAWLDLAPFGAPEAVRDALRTGALSVEPVGDDLLITARL